MKSPRRRAAAFGAGGRFATGGERVKHRGPGPKALIAASGRRTRRRSSQRDRSLTVSPGPEAFPEGTLEIALVCTGRKEAVATTLPCSDFATGGRG